MLLGSMRGGLIDSMDWCEEYLYSHVCHLRGSLNTVLQHIPTPPHDAARLVDTPMMQNKANMRYVYYRLRNHIL